MDTKPKAVKSLFKKSGKNPIGEAIMETLAKDGFRPAIDGDFIVFRWEGRTFYFTCDKDDVNFCRLVFPNFYEVTFENKTLALYNMNHLNQSRKFAFLYLDDDRVSIAVDLYLTPEVVPVVVPRMMSLVRSDASEFVDEMKKGFDV